MSNYPTIPLPPSLEWSRRLPLTRKGTGYTFAGCDIQMTADFRWAVSRNGDAVGPPAPTMLAAKSLAVGAR